MTKLHAGIVALFTVCIIQASFIAVIIQTRQTWVRVALQTHEIAWACMVDAQGELTALVAKVNADNKLILVPRTLPISQEPQTDGDYHTTDGTPPL